MATLAVSEWMWMRTLAFYLLFIQLLKFFKYIFFLENHLNMHVIFSELGTSRLTISQASTSVSMTVPSFSRMRPIAPLSSRQQYLVLPHGLEDIGDDCIVPSTPTLYVPRRSDGFGEAVSSPHVPTSGRFTFNESTSLQSSTMAVAGGSSEVVPEQTLETSLIDDNSMKICLRMRVFNNEFYCYRYGTQCTNNTFAIISPRSDTCRGGAEFFVRTSCSNWWYVIFYFINLLFVVHWSC